jgi:hypothetical protein
MYYVYDLNDYEDLFIEVLQNKMLLLYNHVQVNEDYIIHFIVLAQSKIK